MKNALFPIRSIQISFLIYCLLCSVNLMFSASLAGAEENHTVTATWDYSSFDGLAGFKLYHQGQPLCQTDNPADREISCPVTICEENNEFTLTAYDVDNNESAPSDVYAVIYPLNNPVNTPPVTAELNFNTQEDMELQGALAGSDADNDNLVYSVVDSSVNGVVELIDVENGIFKYTPSPDFSGNDSFSYWVSDGQEYSNISTVSMQVAPVNDPPEVVGESVSTFEDASVNIAILLNDNDVDSDTLSLVGVGNPMHGTTMIDGNNVVYTPSINYNGLDSFTYNVSDGNTISNGTVSIVVMAVNDAPVAINSGIDIQEEEVFFGSLSATDVDNTSLTYIVVNNSGYGSVEMLDATTGAFKYTPAMNFYGQDSFTFQAIDGTAVSNTATVTVDVTPVNDSPVANAGPDQNVTLGDVVTLDATNSFDVDSNITSIEWVQVSGASINLSDPTDSQPTFDTFDLPFESASLIFQVTVTDAEGATSQDSALVNVSWVNTPPVADAGPDQSVFEGDVVTLDATQSTDSDDGIASILWSQVSGISVTLSEATGSQATFVAPETDLNGETLVFELVVTDIGGLQAISTIRVNVSWINDSPVAEAGLDQNVNEGDNVNLDASASFDPDDGIQSVHWTQTNGIPVTLSNPAGFMTSFVAPQIVTESSDLVFMVTVTDFGGLQHSDTVTVTVAQPISEQEPEPEDPIIAEVVFGTNNLEVGSKGRWVKINIELPDGYTIEEIDIDSIVLSRINDIDLEQPLSTTGPAEIGDDNNNGVPDLSVKFDRKEFLPLLIKGDNLITVSGSLCSGTLFEQVAVVSY